MSQSDQVTIAKAMKAAGFSAEEVARVLSGESPRASSPVSSPTESRSKDGRDFPCSATKPCKRMLRSKGRAAIHGVDAGGHVARSK